MLMITRRAGERVIVGGNIVITLVEVSGQTARIGIEAPKSMPIFREEIWVEVMRENEAAAQAASAKLPDIVAPLPATPEGSASSGGASGGGVDEPADAEQGEPAEGRGHGAERVGDVADGEA
jgi:carbon storage regulator